MHGTPPPFRPRRFEQRLRTDRDGCLESAPLSDVNGFYVTHSTGGPEVTPEVLGVRYFIRAVQFSTTLIGNCATFSWVATVASRNFVPSAVTSQLKLSEPPPPVAALF